VRKDSDIDTIKDTINLIGDKILLSLGIEMIGVDCVFRELGLVSWILMLIYINRCVRCGSKSPGGTAGRMCEWMSNYTECAVCHSLSQCHVCDVAYRESDLVVKCVHCDRWSHVSCKASLGEDEANKLIKQGI